jgi:hypothetical protein
MWVLLPWSESLFAQEVRDQAERKLRLVGVDINAELNRLTRRASSTT